jgi:hypothetical protein
MKSTLKYRSAHVVLAVMFAVFNIGIPVVIAACPMPKAFPGGGCIACYEGSGSSSITTERSASCCATVIVAERNTNVFAQAKSNLLDTVSPLVVLSACVFFPIRALQSSLCSVEVSSSPPASVDIPLFISSLLI